jgi:hypothetical protein
MKTKRILVIAGLLLISLIISFLACIVGFVFVMARLPVLEYPVYLIIKNIDIFLLIGGLIWCCTNILIFLTVQIILSLKPNHN